MELLSSGSATSTVVPFPRAVNINSSAWRMAAGTTTHAEITSFCS